MPRVKIVKVVKSRRSRISRRSRNREESIDSESEDNYVEPVFATMEDEVSQLREAVEQKFS